MSIALYIIVGLLIAGVGTLIILSGKKRGGCLESFRLFTVLLAGVLTVAFTVLPVFILIRPGFLKLPKGLVPIAKELALNFVVPVAALVVFIVLNLVMLIVYLIVGHSFKKGKHSAACMDITTKSKVLGIVCAVLISAIVAVFLAIPAARAGSLYNDYEENKENLLTLYSLSKGENVKPSEILTSVDELSQYILSIDYVSDDAKVEALNYAIETLNKKLGETNNAALNGVSLKTYSSITKHKKQISSVVGVAKSLEKAGILEDLATNATISEEKIFDAVTSEDTTRELVDAIGELENGGEMFSEVINGMVSDMSHGEVKNIVNESVMKDIDGNKEAIVQTMMLAECFKDITEEKYLQMGAPEREELITKLESIVDLGVVDKEACGEIIGNIKKSIGK